MVPDTWFPHRFNTLKKLREEDNLSTKDSIAEFILSSMHPLFRGFTVVYLCVEHV